MAPNSSLWGYIALQNRSKAFSKAVKARGGKRAEDGICLSLHSPESPTESRRGSTLHRGTAPRKSPLVDVVRVPSPSLRAGAFRIRSEGSATAKAAPD